VTVGVREVDGKKEFSFNGEVNPAFPRKNS
jgi:hypothetical protein